MAFAARAKMPELGRRPPAAGGPKSSSFLVEKGHSDSLAPGTLRLLASSNTMSYG